MHKYIILFVMLAILAMCTQAQTCTQHNLSTANITSCVGSTCTVTNMATIRMPAYTNNQLCLTDSDGTEIVAGVSFAHYDFALVDTYRAYDISYNRTSQCWCDGIFRDRDYCSVSGLSNLEEHDVFAIGHVYLAGASPPAGCPLWSKGANWCSLFDVKNSGSYILGKIGDPTLHLAIFLAVDGEVTTIDWDGKSSRTLQNGDYTITITDMSNIQQTKPAPYFIKPDWKESLRVTSNRINGPNEFNPSIPGWVKAGPNGTVAQQSLDVFSQKVGGIVLDCPMDSFLFNSALTTLGRQYQLASELTDVDGSYTWYYGPDTDMGYQGLFSVFNEALDDTVATSAPFSNYFAVDAIVPYPDGTNQTSTYYFGVDSIAFGSTIKSSPSLNAATQGLRVWSCGDRKPVYLRYNGWSYFTNFTTSTLDSQSTRNELRIASSRGCVKLTWISTSRIIVDYGDTPLTISKMMDGTENFSLQIVGVKSLTMNSTSACPIIDQASIDGNTLSVTFRSSCGSGSGILFTNNSLILSTQEIFVDTTVKTLTYDLTDYNVTEHFLLSICSQAKCDSKTVFYDNGKASLTLANFVPSLTDGTGLGGIIFRYLPDSLNPNKYVLSDQKWVWLTLVVIYAIVVSILIVGSLIFYYFGPMWAYYLTSTVLLAISLPFTLIFLMVRGCMKYSSRGKKKRKIKAEKKVEVSPPKNIKTTKLISKAVKAVTPVFQSKKNAVAKTKPKSKPGK